MISYVGQGLVLLALLLCAIGSPVGFVAGLSFNIWSIGMQ